MRLILIAVLTLAACSAAPAGPRFVPGAAAPPQALNADFLDRAVAEINLARTDPQAYADKVRAWRALFVGDRVQRPGRITLITEEGTAAVDETIAFLERQPALPVLNRSNLIDRAALDHALEQSRTGQVGHYGEGGSTPTDRMRRYGRWGATGEAIAYGSDTPEDVVLQLIIDDGVPDRGHRLLLFSRDYALIGAACETHPEWRQVCVFDVARAAQL